MSPSPLPPPPPSSSPLTADDAEIRRLVVAAEQLVRPVAAEGTPAGGRARERRRRRRYGAPPPTELPHTSGRVTDASCDASGEWTSSSSGSSSDDEHTSSDSDTLHCSVATVRDADATPPAGRDVTGHRVSPTANQLAERPESATPQAALPCSEQRPSAPLPPVQLVISPPGHVTDLSSTDLADPTSTPTPTSSSGCSVILSGHAPSGQPTNSRAAATATWAGRRRARARRPIVSLSSDSERSPTVYRRRRGHHSPPATAADSDAADLNRDVIRAFQFCATDASLEDLSQSDGGTNDDVVSSVSEQAWDPYQEYKDIPELGSEPSVDPETVRRFLDTDDYRRFIDSLSDCTSSQVSSVPPAPRRLRRKLRVASDSLDSDTDGGDEVAALLADSRHRLQCARAELSRRADQPDPIYSGIVAACRAELTRLDQLQAELGGCRDASAPYLKPALGDVKAVIQQWCDLRTATMELERRADSLSRLQDRIRSFRHGLVSLDERTGRAGRHLDSTSDFQARIAAVKALQQELSDLRLELVNVNTDVHQHVTSGGGGQSSLKDDVATLYRIWDEVNHRAQSQLEHLSDAAATWREFEAERAALQAAMEADRRRLGLLRQAIAGEADVTSADVMSADVTVTDVTVTDVMNADVTAEDDLNASDITVVDVTVADATSADVTATDGGRTDVTATVGGAANGTKSPRGGSRADGAREGNADGAPRGGRGAAKTLAAGLGGFTSPGVDDLSEGTSGYDSACSDDLSERERRLGRLRRMATDLETLLAPAGPAWSDIEHTLSTATADLRQLQQSCRHLVARTASQLPIEGAAAAGGWRQRGSPVLRRKAAAAGPRRDNSAPFPARARAGRRTWTRRVLRAALPFQLGLLLWLCAAYLLEPGCCDDLNYLARSLTPQLRYVSGPPPI